MSSIESHSISSSSSSPALDGEAQLDDSVRASRSRHNDEFVLAMKEDLAEWLNTIHAGLTLTADDFFDQLETGVVLCRHANVVVTNRTAVGERQIQCSENELAAATDGDRLRSSTGNLVDCDGTTTASSVSPSKRLAKVALPGEVHSIGRPQTAPPTRTSLVTSNSQSSLNYMSNAQPRSFHARDNLSQFISWCRTVLRVPNALLFETEDLVSRKNERNVILCLLEVARRGTRMYGMPAPTIVRFEAEIDAEMAGSECSSTTADSGFSGDYGRGIADGEEQHQRHLSAEADTKMNSSSTGNCERKQSTKHRSRPVISVDMMSLDEMVRIKLSACTCPDQYPMIKVAEGKYRIGDSLTHIFLRILRNHVMVRIGGGWDTLDSYLDRHDPCRCNSKQNRGTHAFRSNMTSQNGSVNDVSWTSNERVTSASTSSLADSAVSNRPSQSQQDIPSRTVNGSNSVTTLSQLATSSTSIADPNRRRLGPDANSSRNVSVSTVGASRPSNACQPSVVPDQGKSKTASATTTQRDTKDGSRQRPAHETSSMAGGGSSSDLTKPMTSKIGRRPSPSRPSTPTSCNPAAALRQDGVNEQTCLETPRSTQSNSKIALHPSRIVGHGTAIASGATRGRVAIAKITSTPTKQNRSRSTGAEEIKRHLSGNGALRAFHGGTSASSSCASSSTPVVMVKDMAPSARRRLLSERFNLAGGNDHKLLPDYRPLTKTRPTCLRSFSVDYSASGPLLASYNFDDETVNGTNTPSFGVERHSQGDYRGGSCRLRRSMSVQEPATFATSPMDLLDPPPEDPELNVRMEMLFEEYRKVERGRSPCPVVGDDSSMKNGTKSGGCKVVTTKKTSGKEPARVGVSVDRWSVRANSVGDLLSSPTSSCLTLHRTARGGKESPYGGSSTSLTSRSVTPSGQIGRNSLSSTPRGMSTTQQQSSNAKGRRTGVTAVASTNSPRTLRKTNSSRQNIDGSRATPEPRWNTQRDAVPCQSSGTRIKPKSSGSSLSRSLSDVSSRKSFSTLSCTSAGRELSHRIQNRSNPPEQQPQHQQQGNRSYHKTNGWYSPVVQPESSMVIESMIADTQRQQVSATSHPRDQLASEHETVRLQQNGLQVDHATSSMLRSRIPVPVGSSARRSSSKPRPDNEDGAQQSFALRRFDSGVDLGNALSPTADYGPQFSQSIPGVSAAATMTSGQQSNGAKQVVGLHSFVADRTFADDDEFY